jgi:hypothetical protein
MSITIKEFDGYNLKEEVNSMAKKCAPKKKEACAPTKKKNTKEACKTKKKKK